MSYPLKLTPGGCVLAVATISQTLHPGIDHQSGWNALHEHPLLATGVSKGKWAERHLYTLKSMIDQVFSDPANHPELVAELDHKSSYHVFRIKTLPDINSWAEPFAYTIADVVTNLQGALDQFVWQLALDFTNGTPPRDPKWVSFPMCDTPDLFTKKERTRVQVAAEHWGFLQTYQPYHGPAWRFDTWSGPYAHELSLIRDFANDDKHRITRPILLAPNQLQLVNCKFIKRDDGSPEWLWQDASTELEFGAEVFRVRMVPDTEPQIDPAGSFIPQVALHEGRPAIATLARLVKFVQVVFSDFQRVFPP